jgi:poly-gamma-glutamate synthesis protein (capsule biosynthesis protein)
MVDIVYGHSSHHPKAIEVYRGELILYGCGDFTNDYEGIGDQDAYRGDLVPMYIATLSAEDGTLRRLDMVPFCIHRFRLRLAEHHEAAWLAATLSREGAPLGTRVELAAGGALQLCWT